VHHHAHNPFHIIMLSHHVVSHHAAFPSHTPVSLFWMLGPAVWAQPVFMCSTMQSLHHCFVTCCAAAGHPDRKVSESTLPLHFRLRMATWCHLLWQRMLLPGANMASHHHFHNQTALPVHHIAVTAAWSATPNQSTNVQKHGSGKN
jgi:hypothetical protein